MLITRTCGTTNGCGPFAVRSGWLRISPAQGDLSVASGWLGRAERLLEDQEDDCVERGYLLIPVMFRREASGDFAAAAATAGDAAEFGGASETRTSARSRSMRRDRC